MKDEELKKEAEAKEAEAKEAQANEAGQEEAAARRPVTAQRMPDVRKKGRRRSFPGMRRRALLPRKKKRVFSKRRKTPGMRKLRNLRTG